MRQGMRRLAMTVLWPSFLAAAMAEGLFFSLFEPDMLSLLPPVTVYSIGFFFFWTLCVLASMLTFYLVTVPEDHNRPF
jgi:hypothetical protein